VARATAPSSKKSIDPPAGRRRGLSRDMLIAAAVKLIDQKGAEALSMRALAQATGVTTMALYNHFSSKRDLLSAVAQRLIEETHFDGGHADWRTQLRHCFGELRGLCLRHPGLPGLLQQEGTTTGAAFGPMEVTLRALEPVGMTALERVRVFYLLIGFTLSQAAYQSRPAVGLEPSEQIRTHRIAGRGFAAVERLELPQDWDFKESFEFGLTLVLDGIEQNQRRSASRDP
jgi:TetR/AcrR family transcriptional regulator, tetracycline repressor protein